MHVNYTKISPNSNPRIRKIRRITPHCMAGNLSVERCLNLANFQAGAKNPVSCNYAIDSAGRIGVCVDENRRSWCSSNQLNDDEAITVEIANTGLGPMWPMSDEAISKFTELCIYICNRYGYNKVIFRNDGGKNTKTEPNELLITLHQYYANKACPGQYLINKLPEIVGKINAKLATTQTVDGLFKVRITTDILNIRKSPTTDSDISGSVKKGQVFTITAVVQGTGSTKGFGKLKSGAGYISLDYTEQL